MVFGMWIWLVMHCRISPEMEVVAIKMMVCGPWPSKKNRRGLHLYTCQRKACKNIDSIPKDTIEVVKT